MLPHYTLMCLYAIETFYNPPERYITRGWTSTTALIEGPLQDHKNSHWSLMKYQLWDWIIKPWESVSHPYLPYLHIIRAGPQIARLTS